METTIGNGTFNIQRQLSLFYTGILIVNIWGCKNNRCLNWRFWDFEDEFRHDYLYFQYNLDGWPEQGWWKVFWVAGKKPRKPLILATPCDNVNMVTVTVTGKMMNMTIMIVSQSLLFRALLINQGNLLKQKVTLPKNVK